MLLPRYLDMRIYNVQIRLYRPRPLAVVVLMMNLIFIIKFRHSMEELLQHSEFKKKINHNPSFFG